MMIDRYRILIMSLTLILCFLFMEILDQKDNEDDTPMLKVATPDWDVILSRFLAFMFLHITFCNEYKQAYKIMKYTLNHYEKFRAVYSAYFVGFMQFVVSFATEIYSIITLLTASTN